ncbi:actin-like ATPase domain-containing protein [Viridothelium virens]|uniref:Actin-like ATPase domain-containing protein n=1 Tax=Viridothelium virens TaxID=1048519 RepID=A0A6A6HE72_VIRVR|nr:actin-like ATPase domain-containing protein [Viridothelium virens]
MVGKKSGKALLREEGLERTDNNLDLTTWPQVNMINQKNYYTDYLKRDDQILALRLQNEDARNRMTKEARDRDRALALNGRTDPDGEIYGNDEVLPDETAASASGQEVWGSKIVVVHPGSQNLRIGLASDALPRTVPMVIARKWSSTESEDETEGPLPKRVKFSDDEHYKAEKLFGDEFAKEYGEMSQELKVHMRNNKRRVLPNSKEVIVNFNEKTEPENISEHNDPQRIDWTEIPKDPTQAPDFITGQAALRIPDNSRPKYRLFWPIRNGVFNEKDYASKNLLYQDFATIIEDAIKAQLSLKRKAEWAQYGCVFVIPDLYDRAYILQTLEMLIKDFGFGRVCFIQESLAATFGAGYSMACIVDMGAQKTSVCCVEDGMCVEESRINLKYGGRDVTDNFIRMMLFDHFHYQDIDLRRRYDYLLAEELKQKFCTMNEAEISQQLYDFHLRAPSQDTRKYLFKTYDEPLLAPMGYFRPTIFDHSQRMQGRRRLIDRSYDLYDGLPNDPMSPAQLAVIQYATGNPAFASAAAAPALEALTTTANTSTPGRQPQLNLLNRLNNESEATPRSSEAGSPAPDGTGTPQLGRAASPGAVAVQETANAQANAAAGALQQSIQQDKTLPIMPLDVAIITSITHAARGDERKFRDFLGGVMVAGGGGKIVAFKQVLEERLQIMQPAYARDILVGSPPRDLDPQVLVWKGASVFGKLSVTNDSWIGQMEYDRLGSRLLAYKCMWSW